MSTRTDDVRRLKVRLLLLVVTILGMVLVAALTPDTGMGATPSATSTTQRTSDADRNSSQDAQNTQLPQAGDQDSASEVAASGQVAK